MKGEEGQGEELGESLEELLFILYMVTALWVYPYIKTYQTVHFKYVQVIICQLQLNKVVFKKQAILQGQFAKLFRSLVSQWAPINISKLHLSFTCCYSSICTIQLSVVSL